MNDKVDANGALLPDDKRITPIGAWVRKSSIDELPQLINVIKGEMSLVGPRPFLAEYLTIYTPEEMKRLTVKPGITGWAQVNGRNLLSWKQKFALDIWYVNRISFLLDLKVLFLTVSNVFKAEGINGKNENVEKYNGYN